MATVYVETSVPSAYVSARTDPKSLSRKAETIRWWTAQLPEFDAFISENVTIELRRGRWEGQDEAVALVTPLAVLPTTDEVLAVAARYIREKLVPADLIGDAAHLAFASIYEMDHLATWNIRHLANLNKQRHLLTINRRLGLMSPQILTPEMLWLEDNP